MFSQSNQNYNELLAVNNNITEQQYDGQSKSVWNSP
jgi:hypothetical protein